MAAHHTSHMVHSAHFLCRQLKRGIFTNSFIHFGLHLLLCICTCMCSVYIYVVYTPKGRKGTSVYPEPATPPENHLLSLDQMSLSIVEPEGKQSVAEKWVRREVGMLSLASHWPRSHWPPSHRSCCTIVAIFCWCYVLILPWFLLRWMILILSWFQHPRSVCFWNTIVGHHCLGSNWHRRTRGGCWCFFSGNPIATFDSNTTNRDKSIHLCDALCEMRA